MKITKYAQSCVLLETKDKKILIDPGYLLLDDVTLKSWLDVDIILVTHKHGDHCDDKSINEIMKNKKIKLYTTNEVVKNHPDISPTKIIKQGDIIKLADIKIEVVKAVHGYVPLLKGRSVIENVGYIVDDGENRAYQTSDTLCFENDYKCDILFIPVCNHGLVMGAFDASLFAKETDAKLVIPIHYDNPRFPTNLKDVEKEFKKQELKYKFLKTKESIDV